MKSLKNPRTVISKDGKTVTITADLVDQQFTQFPVQRVTIGYLNPDNRKHPRHVQISNEATFVKGNGTGVAFGHDELVLIAAAIEPKTSFAPLFKKSVDSFTVEIATELDPLYQWQVSDDGVMQPVHVSTGKRPIEPVYTDIVGQTSKTLDKFTVKAGQWVRCKAYSDAGAMFSNPVQVT